MMQRNGKRYLTTPHYDVTAALPYVLEAVFSQEIAQFRARKARSLGMRYFKLFDSNFTFVQPATNLRFIGRVQPKFDRFLDHFFRVLRCFTLTNDAEFGATRH